MTLPNFVTICRILLTPLVVLALTAGDCRRALALCLAAGLSDGVDGFLARRFHWESRLGAYLDPIADKLLLTMVYFSLGASALAPWWLVWLVIGRDIFILAMIACAFAFTRHRDFPPSTSGKISTAVQIFTALALLTVCATRLNIVVIPLFWITAATTICSGIDYAARAIRILKKNRFTVPHSFS